MEMFLCHSLETEKQMGQVDLSCKAIQILGANAEKTLSMPGDPNARRPQKMIDIGQAHI